MAVLLAIGFLFEEPPMAQRPLDTTKEGMRVAQIVKARTVHITTDTNYKHGTESLYLMNKEN